MGGRLGVFAVVGRCLAGAVVWGVVLAGAYHASLLHGALVGLWAWGPAIVLAAKWRDAPSDADVPVDAFGP